MCAAVGKVKLGAASSPALLLALRLGWSPRGPAWGEHPRCWFNQGGVRSSPSRGAPEGSASPASASPALWGTQHPKCRKSPRPSPVLTHTGTEGPQVTSPGPAGHPWVPPQLAPCALRAPHVPLLQPHSSQGHPRGSPPCVLLGIWGSEGTKKRLGGPVPAPQGRWTSPHVTVTSPSLPRAPLAGKGRTQPCSGSVPPLHKAGAPRGGPHPAQHPGGGGRGQDVGQTHSHGCLGTVLGTQGGQDVTDAVPAPSGPRPWSTQPQSVLRGPLPW